MARRGWLSCGFAFAASLLAAGCRVGPAPPPTSPPASPDVLIVTLDTTRRDVLGCYGSAVPTPELDRLAEKGIVLDELFSLGFGTSPSHASLFVSAHPYLHGVYDNATPLPLDRTTLAERLRAEGWKTAAFVSAVPVGARLGFARGFDHFDEDFVGGSFERPADRTVSASLDWLERHEGEGPVFVWVHLYDPHQPYDPPVRFRTETDEAVADRFLDAAGAPRFLRPEELPSGELPRIDAEARRRYRGEVDFVDEQLGRLLAALRERGRRRKALVLVVADHGESFLSDGAAYAFGHGGLRGSVSRLAGILELPDEEGAGTRSSALLGNHDLAATVLDAVGAEVPLEWTGRSALDVLRTGRDAFRPRLVLEASERSLISVRTPAWAYMEPWGSGHPVWGVDPVLDYTLYDLGSDPDEHHNLYHQLPAVVEEMHGLVAAFLDLARQETRSETRRPIDDPEHLEALRALGYLP